MTARSPAAFDALAGVLRYPDNGYRALARGCAATVEGLSAEAASRAAAFAGEISDLDRDEIGELYTRTFDLDPACALDLGWHLYGEAYERGRFLVTLRGLLRAHGVAERIELPDHIAHVLPLLGRMEPGQAAELAKNAVAPALTTMRDALESTDNPFRHALAAAGALVDEALIEGVCCD